MDKRSPVQHALVLHRIEPDRGIARFYSLLIERDLFGTIRLVRNWGRIGTTAASWRRCSRPRSRPGRRLKRWPRRSGDEAIGTCERAGNPAWQADYRTRFHTWVSGAPYSLL